MDVPATETKLQKSKEKSIEKNEETMAGLPLVRYIAFRFVCSVLINPLHPNISVYILHTLITDFNCVTITGSVIFL